MSTLPSSNFFKNFSTSWCPALKVFQLAYRADQQSQEQKLRLMYSLTAFPPPKKKILFLLEIIVESFLASDGAYMQSAISIILPILLPSYHQREIKYVPFFTNLLLV